MDCAIWEGFPLRLSFWRNTSPQVDCLIDNPNMMGFCIIQLYDVEPELNGMYTYDRRLKYDKARLKEIMSRKAAVEDYTKGIVEDKTFRL